MELHEKCLVDKALRKISEKEGIETEKAKAEILSAVYAAMKMKPEAWDGVVKSGEDISAEAVIWGIAEQVKNKL